MKTFEGEETKLHVLLTYILDGGEWSVSRSNRFTLGKERLAIFCEKDPWDTQPVWTRRKREKSVTLSGIELRLSGQAYSLVTTLVQLPQKIIWNLNSIFASNKTGY
jgi:hypothetical protein